MAEHAKTPWRIGKNGVDDVVLSGNDVVAMCDTDTNPQVDKANAAFIVRACNNFEELVEQLKHARDKLANALVSSGMDPYEIAAECDPYDAVLAKARGETP